MPDHPWLKEYPAEVPPSYEYPKRNLAYFLIESAAAHPDRDALDFLGKRIKYRELLDAALVAVLIGERPGLSAPDSLGVYLTWAPRVGCVDAQRNCISNVRPQGLSYALAARRLAWLLREARARGISGVALKDESGTQQLQRQG